MENLFNLLFICLIGSLYTVSTTNGSKNETQSLFEAMKEGNQEALKLMLNEGANINAKDSSGNILLLENIKRNNSLNMTKFLVNNGADLETVDEQGRGALLVAVSFGRDDQISYLLENGANVNVTDLRGRNAAHLAATEGRTDVLKVLGENLNNMINMTDDYGKTPLWYAAEGAHEEAFAQLKSQTPFLEPDMLVAGVKGGNLDIVKSLVKAGQDVNTKNQSGASVLQMACDVNRDLVAMYLIEEGADLNIKDGQGKSLLHLCSTSGSDEVVNILLSKGLQADSLDLHGDTALHIAAANNKVNVIETLLKNNAKIDNRNKQGESPAESAIKRNSLSALTYLIKQGYKIDQINSENKTLCHVATISGSASAVKLLLEQGANCEGMDSFGNYPMHYAVDNQQALKNLLEGGLKPDVLDRDGTTPLKLAALRGNTRSALCLLKYGANSEGVMSTSSPDDRYYAYVENSPIIQSRETINQYINKIKKGDLNPKDIDC